MRRSNGAKIREIMRERGNACVYCGIGMWIAYDGCKRNDRMATLDHVIPKAIGGSNHNSNLVLACYRCNYERGSMAQAEFIDRRLALGEKEG
ncbi:HNH endonuclease [Ancylobacter oerskovii]|uniref:HNH endonuclease n=1 Tax=Ancylobacter oerskovii TaxID=459519 RepID=A0ABW4YVQ7_9HYPH|nr:HNH endonuclease [Ancylobacter oerskovii]MBS7544329.1 HNH endonuclease [Ancylobacter oerskovii]